MRPLALLLLAWPALVAQAPAGPSTPAPVGPPVRLSLADAYRLALRNNLQARIARDVREVALTNVEIERGIFDWTLFANAGAGRQQAEDANPRSSGLGTIFFGDIFADQETRSATVGLSKLFGAGGTASLSFTPFRSATTIEQHNHLLGSDQIVATEFATENPYGGRFTLAFNQPLLRGRGAVAVEARLKEAQEQAAAAEISYRLSLIQLLVNTDNLYWDYVFAVQNLANKREALRLAQQQLSDDSEKVKSGMLAPLELPQVEASVADREKQVYSAEAAVANSRAALLTQLYAELARPADVEIADQPVLVPFDATLDEAERAAQQQRPELKLGAGQVAERQLLERFARNQLLPQLDATASYTGNARSQSGVNAAVEDLLAARLPGYFVGLKLQLPIGNHAARGALAQASAARHEAELVVANIREGIRLEVQQAFTATKAAEKEVAVAQKALDFHQQSLQAETDKFASGYSTSFFVLQRQDELDQARTSFIQAQVDYRKALTELQRAMGVLLDRRLAGEAL